MIKSSWFYIWLITLLIAIAVGDALHQTGYEKGRAETPPNVVRIDHVIIDQVNGGYRFSVISGNQTFTVLEKTTPSNNEEINYDE